MKVTVTLDVNKSTIQETQKTVKDLFDHLLEEKIIENYSFEIATDSGVVTEKCILSEGRVIA